jgi:hypothetical protein
MNVFKFLLLLCSILSVPVLLLCTDGEGPVQPQTSKNGLHPKYKGIISGSDAKIVFEDSSKTYGNVSLILNKVTLSLTYSQNGDSITFYTSTVPTYQGIIAGPQISIYQISGTVLLGAVAWTVQETGPLSGKYFKPGAASGTYFYFTREDGTDSALYYSAGSSDPMLLTYRVSKDSLVLIPSVGTGSVCFLSDTKNAFWYSEDNSIYMKDTTIGTGKIDILSGVMPKSEYKVKGSITPDGFVRGLGFGTDSIGSNYYYIYKYSYAKNANVYVETGSYLYNTYNNTIIFKVDNKGCTDGNGNLTSCYCGYGMGVLHSNAAVPFIVLEGESFYKE